MAIAGRAPREKRWLAARLILDIDSDRLTNAAGDSFVGFLGDATREQDLIDAGVGRAKALLICLGRDDTAVLTVLTARQLNPGLRVICSVTEEENIKLIRHAGADVIIAPSVVGGHLMADSVQASHIADYINDLMREEGRVRLFERPRS